MTNILPPSQTHGVPTPDVGAVYTQSSACFQVSLSIQMLKLTVSFVIIYHTKRIAQTHSSSLLGTLVKMLKRLVFCKLSKNMLLI